MPPVALYRAQLNTYVGLLAALFRAPLSSSHLSVRPIAGQLILTNHRSVYSGQSQSRLTGWNLGKKRPHGPVKAFSAHTAPRAHHWTDHSLWNIVTSYNSLYKEWMYNKYCYCWSAVVVHRTQPYSIPHHIIKHNTDYLTSTYKNNDKNNHTGQSIQSLCTILMKWTIKDTACEKIEFICKYWLGFPHQSLQVQHLTSRWHMTVKFVLLTFLLSWVFYQADITNVYSTTANTDTPTRYLSVCCVYNTKSQTLLHWHRVIQ
jgi:hypothetical protein